MTAMLSNHLAHDLKEIHVTFHSTRQPTGAQDREGGSGAPLWLRQGKTTPHPPHAAGDSAGSCHLPVSQASPRQLGAWVPAPGQPTWPRLQAAPAVPSADSLKAVPTGDRRGHPASGANLRSQHRVPGAQGPPADHHGLWSALPSAAAGVGAFAPGTGDLRSSCTRALTQGRPVRVAAPAASPPRGDSDACACGVPPPQMPKRETGVGTRHPRPPEPTRPTGSPAQPHLPVPQLRLAPDPYCPFRVRLRVCPSPWPQDLIHSMRRWGVARGWKGSLLHSSTGQEDSKELHFLQLMCFFKNIFSVIFQM